MATIKSATIQSLVSAIAEMDGDGVAGNRVPIQFVQELRMLSPTSTPPVSLVCAMEILFAGSSTATDTQTIDLSDFDDVEGVAQDGQGLQVHAIQIVASADNVDVVTIGPAALNGYALFGSGIEVDIPPGAQMVFYAPNELPVVEGDSGSLNTDIDVTGNGGDSVQIIVLLG